MHLHFQEIPDHEIIMFDLTLQNLPDVDVGGHCDPFIMIDDATPPNRNLHKTAILKNVKNASFKNIVLDVLNHPTINIRIFDYDGKFLADDFLGKSEMISLQQVSLFPGETELPLTTQYPNFKLKITPKNPTLAAFSDDTVDGLHQNFTNLSFQNSTSSAQLYPGNRPSLQTNASTFSRQETINLMDFKFKTKPFYGQIRFKSNVKVKRGGHFGKLNYSEKFHNYKIKDLNPIENWSRKKLLLTNKCLIFIEQLDNTVSNVMIIDHEFWFRADKRTVDVESTQRKTEIKFAEEQEARYFVQELAQVQAIITGNQRSNPHDSFSPIQPQSRAKWFIGGRDYFHYLFTCLLDAKKEIFITDWYLSPKVLLYRNYHSPCKEYQLNNILLQKAKEGVKIYIQIFGPPDFAGVGIAATDCAAYFNHLHDNIQCMEHMSGMEDSKMWSHHEKLVIVDQSIAFVGGIDLCSGRYDDNEFRLWDNSQFKIWPGKDYRNTFTFDLGDVSYAQWDVDQDSQIRTKQPRCPWEDIASVVYGPAASDVAVHFIQRWNFTKAQEKKQDLTRTYSRFRPLVPLDYSEYPDFRKFHNLNYHTIEKDRINSLSHFPEFDQLHHLNVQCLRSSANWSLGLKHKENSIQKAYIKLISEAENFIYIENQFFVTAIYENLEGVNNRIGQAIFNAIVKHHGNGKKFKIFIVIPHVPEFNFDPLNCQEGFNEAKVVMHWQYWSISRHENSIFQQLQKRGINPEDYIYFTCMRQHGLNQATGQPVGQTVYVHSKLLIVDDQHVVIGSANINDRSMEGDRDSEFCLYFSGEKPSMQRAMSSASFNENIIPVAGMSSPPAAAPIQATRSLNFAKSLRIKIFSMLLGLPLNHRAFDDSPNTDTFWNYWKQVARLNFQYHSLLVPTGPTNFAKSYAEMNQYRNNFQPLSPNQVNDVRQKIQGYLIEFPLDFLAEESLYEAPLASKVGLAQMIAPGMFT